MGENKKVKHTAGKTKRGIKPGDKIVNRKGGGTPPPQIVTNPARIAGIKSAFIKEVAFKAGSDHDWVVDHVRYLFGMPEGAEIDVTTSEGGQKFLDDAVAFAKKVVPDWKKLPTHEAIGLEHLGNTPTPTRKRKQLKTPKVVANHVRVTRWVDTPPSQIAKVMEAEARKRQVPPPAPKPTPMHRSGARVLPEKVDTASARCMGALIGG